MVREEIWCLSLVSRCSPRWRISLAYLLHLWTYVVSFGTEEMVVQIGIFLVKIQVVAFSRYDGHTHWHLPMKGPCPLSVFLTYVKRETDVYLLLTGQRTHGSVSPVRQAVDSGRQHPSEKTDGDKSAQWSQTPGDWNGLVI